MPAALVRRLLLCLAIVVPAIACKIGGLVLNPVPRLAVFGAAVVGASFMLAWAAEAARKDISGALAIAILALIAVLPEYAVDLYYAFRSGSDPAYEQYAAANMTGANRLLLGLGWPLVVLVSIAVARRSATDRRTRTALQLPADSRIDVGVLAIVAVIAFAIPLMGQITLWFGIGLIVAFIAYLWRLSQVGRTGEEVKMVGTATLIAGMPRAARRVTVIAMFVVAAAIILNVAEPFAEALVHSGEALHIDSYFLVQWLAPLASEAPEFIVAVLFALQDRGSAAIGTLISSKINQWTLLVGSLPVAHALGGGGAGLPLDSRQVEEFVLTASQTVLGVAIIIGLRFRPWAAIALAALFAVQFAVTETGGRYVLSAIHIGLAIVLLVIQRRHVVETLTAPFRLGPPTHEPGR